MPHGVLGQIGPRVLGRVYRGFMTTKRVQRRRGPRPAARVDLLALTGETDTIVDDQPDLAAPAETEALGESPRLGGLTPPSRTR